MCVRKQIQQEKEDDDNQTNLRTRNIQPPPNASKLLGSPRNGTKRTSLDNTNAPVFKPPSPVVSPRPPEGKPSVPVVPAPRNVRGPGPLKSDLRDLLPSINPDTFDVSDPNKRPQGWLAVRLKRVEEVERIERNKGVGESEITFKRAARVKEVNHYYFHHHIPCFLIKCPYVTPNRLSKE
jgi:hypothetical protein